MPRPAPEAGPHDLALVGRVVLERLALDLGGGLERQADGVEHGADDERVGDGGAREGGGVEGRGRGGEEEQRVGRVDEGVVGAHGDGGGGREVFLREADEPVALLRRGADGHGEDDEVRGRQVESVKEADSRLGNEAIADGPDAGFGEESCSAAREEVILEDGIEAPQAEKRQGPRRIGRLDASIDEVAIFLGGFISHACCVY